MVWLSISALALLAIGLVLGAVSIATTVLTSRAPNAHEPCRSSAGRRWPTRSAWCSPAGVRRRHDLPLHRQPLRHRHHARDHRRHAAGVVPVHRAVAGAVRDPGRRLPRRGRRADPAQAHRPATGGAHRHRAGRHRRAFGGDAAAPSACPTRSTTSPGPTSAPSSPTSPSGRSSRCCHCSACSPCSAPWPSPPSRTRPRHPPTPRRAARPRRRQAIAGDSFSGGAVRAVRPAAGRPRPRRQCPRRHRRRRADRHGLRRGATATLVYGALLSALGAIVWWLPKLTGRGVAAPAAAGLALLGAAGCGARRDPHLIAGFLEQPASRCSSTRRSPTSLPTSRCSPPAGPTTAPVSCSTCSSPSATSPSASPCRHVAAGAAGTRRWRCCRRRRRLGRRSDPRVVHAVAGACRQLRRRPTVTSAEPLLDAASVGDTVPALEEAK